MSEEQDRFDVIVVGSGGGLFGAYAAARRGLRTLVIEKSEFVGGTTAYSGAGIWLPGNPAEVRAGLEGGSEAARPYLDAIIGDDAPVALREAYLEAGPRMIEELEADPAIGEFEWRGVPDYFADAPGALRKGRTIFPANIDRSELGDLEPLVRRPLWTERWGVEAPETMVGGQALIGRGAAGVHQHRQRRGPHEHRARAPDRRGRPGRRRRGRERRRTGAALRRPRRAARRRRLREQPRTPPAVPGADHRRVDDRASPATPATRSSPGIDVGADTALLDEAWFAPGVMAPDGRPVFYTMVWSGIWVNAAGERFMNERLPYDRAGHEILRVAGRDRRVDTCRRTGCSTSARSTGTRSTCCPSTRRCRAGSTSSVDRGRRARSRRHAGGTRRADRRPGRRARRESVEQFNEFAVRGVDEQFHRGETPWDRVTALLFGAHEDGPNRCLGVIDQAPYYAVQVVVTDLGTKGGLVTDADARVLRPDGSVIEGLYASGNTMAPALGRIYPGAGGPIGSAMVFSYLAALDMAALDTAERS